MLHDIKTLMRRIGDTDFLTADAVTLRSVGGLLVALVRRHPAAPRLLSSACEVAVLRFRESAAFEEQSLWLRVLLHLHGGDGENLFADVLDDDEFLFLESRREAVERRWHSAAVTLSSLPLMERMELLSWLCQQDVSTSSESFERCRAEVFGGSHIPLQTVLSYYHLLRHARPHDASLENARLHREYTTFLGTLVGGWGEEESPQWWQHEEVRWLLRLDAVPRCSEVRIGELTMQFPDAFPCWC